MIAAGAGFVGWREQIAIAPRGLPLCASGSPSLRVGIDISSTTTTTQAAPSSLHTLPQQAAAARAQRLDCGRRAPHLRARSVSWALKEGGDACEACEACGGGNVAARECVYRGHVNLPASVRPPDERGTKVAVIGTRPVASASACPRCIRLQSGAAYKPPHDPKSLATPPPVLRTANANYIGGFHVKPDLHSRCPPCASPYHGAARCTGCRFAPSLHVGSASKCQLEHGRERGEAGRVTRAVEARGRVDLPISVRRMTGGRKYIDAVPAKRREENLIREETRLVAIAFTARPACILARSAKTRIRKDGAAHPSARDVLLRPLVAFHATRYMRAAHRARTWRSRHTPPQTHAGLRSSAGSTSCTRIVAPSTVRITTSHHGAARLDVRAARIHAYLPRAPPRVTSPSPPYARRIHGMGTQDKNGHEKQRGTKKETHPKQRCGSDPVGMSRLETLLDSALATLTLIRDYAPTAPALTIHSSEVLRVLCRHVPVPALCPQPDTVTPTPTPTPTPSPTPALTSTRATYADVTACPTTDPVATSAVAADRHARTNPRAKPERAKERAHSLAPTYDTRLTRLSSRGDVCGLPG
ncbi:hypothetical protein K438DRAFT_2118218 [Mycena galopus ATCC 62051]|nr:hypothetical protein K438DRAFT_2118218 [Mycena galopus ATCC 62051]